MNDPSNESEQGFRWQFGDAEFDESSLCLRVRGEIRELEPKPARVLALLLRHSGEVVTKTELFDSVWEGRLTVDHVLATAIGKVRRVLEDVNGVSIVTAARVGYRLLASVQRIVSRQVEHSWSLQSGQAVPLRPHYRLQRSLAVTAGSEVWLAENPKSRDQRVYKFARDDLRLAALKREATLSRVLRSSLGDRPDLVRILDWNFSEAPYFVECEYAGLSLPEWHAQASMSERADPRVRMDLFLQIAEAVEAAHSVGVLHKDIKPDNVLVSRSHADDLQIKLSDFGSSRLLRPELLVQLGITALGQTAADAVAADSGRGTALYLAPELLAGRSPTVQSDVYALGIVLFQCLVGDFRRSLAPGWERDIDDPLLVADIAAATDGDPQQRTPSAAGLLQSLRRLDERREAAKAAAALEWRAQLAFAALLKARARRPWIAGLLLVLIVGMVWSLWMFRAADAGRRQAESFAASAQAVNEFLSADIIGAANPADHDYDPEQGMLAVLERAADKVDSRFAADPLAAAAVHESIGSAFRTLTRYEPAADHLRRAVRLYGAALGEHHALSLLARYGLVHALSTSDQFDAAEAELVAADSNAGDALHTPTRVALRSAVAHGIYNGQRLRYADALAAYLRAEALHTAVAPDDRELSVFVQTGIAEGYLGTAQFDQAIVILEQLEEQDLSSLRRAALDRMLARAYRSVGKLEQALVHGQRALDAYRRLDGPDSYDSIAALGTLSYVQFLLKDCNAALASALEASARMTAVYGADKQASLIERGNLGARQFECGQQEQGLVNLHAAVHGLRQHHGRDNVAGQNFAFFTSGYLKDIGRLDEALALLDGLAVDALRVGASAVKGDEKLAVLRAEILLKQGKVDEAQVLLRGARASLRSRADNAPLLDQVEALLAKLPMPAAP